ncbi:MAG: hypothetical protein LBE36_06630, partial [Flavobacteriaceae bacterium]|nr:hypothetical protein [Flavobacteriaceae bacterium]
SNVIITDLTRENGEKITVAIKAERKGNALEVNDIASIHGKSAERFLSDMVNAKEGGLQEALRFVDKEKALDWLTIDPPKGSGSNKGLNENTPNWLGNPTERGTPTNPELLSIANIIQNFENPKVGEKMTMEWLLGSFDTTSPETVRADKEDTIRLLIAQRTVEYAQKFGRTDQLTGIGGGIKTDLDVAQEFLNEFNELQNTNPEKYERITEAARRYREYADAGLKYAVDKGRLSEEDYQRIKNNNEYYVNLARVKELSPTEEQNPIFSSGGSVTSVRDIFKKAKGGTDVIQDPFISLLINTANIIRDSDRNEVMRSFIEPLKNVREMGDGEPIEFGEIARPAGSGETNVKTIYVNGVAERWQFSSDTIDAFDDLQSKSDELIYKVFKSPADLIRFTVTHFPVFALRNVTRDTASRLIQSRTDSKFKEMIHNASDEELLALYGGSLSRRFSNGKNDHLIELEAAIRKLTGNKNSIVINPRALWKGYKNLLQKGENINRIAEFKAAYKKAKKEGLDDYNAQLYAAFEARDLMDFAVSGTAIRELNKFIPFLNAGVQGLVRTKKSFTERPLATLAKIAIYSVIPQLIVRMINGDDEDEEYNQLPDYQRDLFWNIKLKGTSTWISIPKPYDVGIFSSLVDRAVDKIKGYDNAFDGLIGSALKTLVPIDESNFLGMFKPIVETMTNYDFFRENTIVNQWEVGKMRELRKGDNDASRISKGITDLIYKTGMDINPKKLDHFIKGYTSYMGDFILRAGDIGKEDSRFKFGVSQTGFAKESPISNAKSVTQAYDLAESTGNLQRKEIKKLRDGIKRYYLLEDEKEKEQLRKKIYNYSKDLVERLKKREQENKK